MELVGIVSNQVLIMFLLIAAGYALYRVKIIDEAGVKQITNLLLIVVTPILIINAYSIPFAPEMAAGLAMAVGLSVIAHLVPIVLTKLIYWKDPSDRARVERFAMIYTNGGFMAIPLVAAVLPENGVFYASSFIVIFNIVQWTQGKRMIQQGKASLSVREILLNPGTIGTAIGLALFFTPLSLPAAVSGALDYVAGLNTPLAMIVIGTYIARADLKRIFFKKRIYFVCLLKLIVIPLLMVGVNRLLNPPSDIMLANVLAVACPSAAATSMFVEKFGGDGLYGSELVVVTTLFSIVTIPAIAILLGVG